MSNPRDASDRIPALHFEPPEEDGADPVAMRTIMPGQFGAAAVNPYGPGAAGPGASPSADDAAPYRPRQRPPMAMLCVLHDGDAGGEWIALRADRYVIARNEGDIRIPHDAQISGRQHAEIARTRPEAGGFLWQLSDLGSTNGTFVRVSKVTLGPGVEVLFGQTRYRFDSGQPAPPPPIVQSQMTVLPGGPAFPRPTGAAPTALVEVTPAGPGERIALIRDEYWLGSDPVDCAIVPRADPFVSPRHARIFRGEHGRWRVENNGSRNGVWLRLTQPLPVEGMCQFLLGEQKFILKVLT